MQRNAAKHKMLGGEPAVGTVAAIRSAMAAGLLARAGCEFVLIDNQHGEWDEASRLEAIRAVYLQGVVPMTRVRINDYAQIGRALDAGALGIIVPMVSTVAQAEAAAFAMRYPPRGGRSTADNLSVNLGADYTTWADDEVFLAVQIETAEGLENVEAIMAVEGVDGCWLGPADLALSLGVAQGSEPHSAAIRRIYRACRQAGKIPGMYTHNPTDARRWIDEGYQFVTISGDARLLETATRAMLAELNAVAKQA